MLKATEKITALYCRLSVEDTKDEKKNGKTSLSVPPIAPTRTSAAARESRRFISPTTSSASFQWMHC